MANKVAAPAIARKYAAAEILPTEEVSPAYLFGGIVSMERKPKGATE